MEIRSHTHPAITPALAQATPAPADTATASDIDALATAMAEQGLFGKLKLGVALLLFGEVTLPAHEKHDA